MNGFHPISSHLDQSEIELIQSIFIWNNQESNSFISPHLINLESISSKSLLNWTNEELISNNLFSSGSIRNPTHKIFVHLDQSGIDLIQSLFIWKNQESNS
ncbi:hypothetical protein CEXT_281111 [Caerostris extrusa]|uniref:Uncharacterized protein n=1 Tax=Caerostris extrusa TaxID=172846 RepID=A0AAV4Q6M5_CAEEX|nr:hypothetical protein CEXT_281111 [Caerostris extrusa]